MNFREYQLRAIETDQNPSVTKTTDRTDEPEKHEIIPLLGLVGEVGGLLSEYKKMLRDGVAYEQFPQQLEEELGDILWYVSTVATKFGLNLEDIATKNIDKTEDRWHEPNTRKPLYDEPLQEDQRFPRQLVVEFENELVDGKPTLKLTDNSGTFIGAALTDNAYEDDGYRYHDIMHLSFMTKLGWSPVMRKLLRAEGKIKHRPAGVDEGEDSGRPQVIDEGIVFAAYTYGVAHGALEQVSLRAVDWTFLKHVRTMTSGLEVRDKSAWEWNDALVAGFRIWRQLIANEGGTVTCDLEAGKMEYTSPL